MKRGLLFVLILSMCLGMCVSFNGCKDNKDDISGAGTVKRYFWEQPKESELAAIKYFEETYGGKVEYTVVQWDQMDLKLLADVSADEAPDLVYIHAGNFPRTAIQKVLTPLEDLNFDEKNDELLAKNAAQVRSEYRFKGKTYAIGNSVAEAVWLYFNKTKFEDAGLKLPTEYLSEGKWNFKTFRELAIQLTADTDGDNKNDQFGFASWRYELFGLANGGKFVDYKDDGSISLLMDAKLQTGLKFMQDGWFTDKYIAPDAGNIWETGFISGSVAMTAENIYKAGVWYEKMKDEWDFVPFPLGEDNVDKAQPGSMDAWGICANGKNPRGALLYLKAMEEYGEKTKNDTPVNKKPKTRDEVLKVMTDEQRSRVETYSKKITTAKYSGIGAWNSKQWPFWDSIKNGEPIATVIETNRPVFQAEIDVTLADTTPPKVENFNGVKKIDFEDGDLSWVSSLDQSGNPMGTKDFAITEDSSEVIDGKKSLKITRQKGEDEGDWQLVCRTNPEKWKIPSYGHTYKITLDYKMLTDMESDGFIVVTLRGAKDVTTGSNSFGWVQHEERAAGYKGSINTTITVGAQAEDLCLVILGSHNGDIVIDNLMIEEV